jgi:pyruvate kinase
MKNTKKAAAKKIAANANTYTLSAAAKKLDAKTIKAATHRGAVLLALRKLGTAPFAAILAEVQKQKKIKTSMDLDKAVRWMCFDLVRKGMLNAR